MSSLEPFLCFCVSQMPCVCTHGTPMAIWKNKPWKMNLWHKPLLQTDLEHAICLMLSESANDMKTRAHISKAFCSDNFIHSQKATRRVLENIDSIGKTFTLYKWKVPRVYLSNWSCLHNIHIRMIRQSWVLVKVITAATVLLAID